MSVYRRGGVWWYKFWFANKLIRESAKTSSKTLAREAEKKRRRELEEGYNGISTEDRSHRVLTLSVAATEFLENYAPRHRATSYRYVKCCVDHLKEQMGTAMLVEIGEKMVLNYQGARLAQGAAGKTINEEVMVLFQVMGDIGDPLRLKLRRQKKLKLATKGDCGRALTPQEEAALMEVARVPVPSPGEKIGLTATRSPAIYPAIAIALNTAMRDSEIRTLTWGQIDFLKLILTVGRSKTKAGAGRTIPINTELFRVLTDHRAWYERKVGPVAPSLYILPYGKARHYDPRRPISTLKTSWVNVRDKAGLKVRFHDLRYVVSFFMFSVLIPPSASFCFYFHDFSL